MAGFTLIEALVATLLMALVGVLLIEALRIGQGAYKRTVAEEQRGRDLFVAQRVLRRLVEDSLPPPSTFSGTSKQLELEAPSSAADGDFGVNRYHVMLRSSGGTAAGERLVVAWQAAGSEASTDLLHEEVLLEGVAAMQIRYLPQAGSGSEPAWSDTWKASQRSPALVRIEVRFPAGDPRHWPPLIVNPRIGDDPNCEFDVVSQGCRSAT